MRVLRAIGSGSNFRAMLRLIGHAVNYHKFSEYWVPDLSYRTVQPEIRLPDFRFRNSQSSTLARLDRV